MSYYLYGNGDSRDPEGPFTEAELLARLVRLTEPDSPDYFKGFVDTFDIRKREMRHGLWAVVRVEVVKPKPVQVVREWSLPEEE